MKKHFLYSLILLLFPYNGIFPECETSFKYNKSHNFSNSMPLRKNFVLPDKAEFIIGPLNQYITISLGGNVIFNLFDLDNSPSVRIEAKVLGIGTYHTISGFENITSADTYIRRSIEIYNELGFGIFQWRVADNSSINHVSQNMILIIVS